MKHIVAQNKKTHWRIIHTSVNSHADRAIRFACARLNASGYGPETVALEVTEDFNIGNVTIERMAEIIAGNTVLGMFPEVAA